MPDDPFALRLYRRLLKLYPAEFRENYAIPMERAFRDELTESSGVGLWLHLLGDLAVSIPAQFAREVAQDALHTFRLWGARPWHTGFAILALAIGIGANTGVFSVVNALLLRSLPFRDPGRLASLQLFFAPHDSARQFHDWRAHSSYLADAAVWEDREANLGSGGNSQRVRVVQTSWNFFALLGTQPILGRTFMAGEDVDGNGWGPPGPNAVAVISYGLWQSLYGGDRQALGSTIRVDGNPLTVIGVAPAGFDYPSKASVWKPAAFSGGNYGWNTIARLKQGIGWDQARTPFLAEAERLWPGKRRPAQSKASTITPLRDELAGPTKNASLVLMACAALILLIACTNVANLLVARTADRTSELSIRSAMGASRARITQQLLTECVLLSLASAFMGLVVAYGAVSLAGKLQPAPLAAQTYSLLDGRVLAVAIAVSLFSGLLFGALPSLYAGRVHAFGTRSTSETRGSRMVREALVAAQVALVLILVTASLSVGRAFIHIMNLDRGFDRTGVVTAAISLDGTGYETDGARLAYVQEALDRVRRLPGVRSASTTQFLPLDAKGFIGGRYRLDGRPASTNSMVVPVMTDYFRTMGGRLEAGREFSESDMRSKDDVAIVTDVFAREFGQPADLIGRQIENSGRARTIVGVVRAMDYVAEGSHGSQIFVPSRAPGFPKTTFVVKVSGRAEDRVAMIRDAIHSMDPRVPLFDVKTMEQRMAGEFARPQFYKTAVMCFTGFALLLAIVGIYGIVAYTVTRRTHEMGVRMALGTTPRNLRLNLLRQGLRPIAGGAVPGVALAVESGHLLESLVEGAKSVDALSYAGAMLGISVIAAMGIWVATRPVARFDIVEILRTE